MKIRQMFARLGSFDHLVYTAGESLQLGDLKTTDLTAARAFLREQRSSAWHRSARANFEHVLRSN